MQVYPDSLPYFIHSLISHYLREESHGRFWHHVAFHVSSEGKDKMKLRVIVVRGYSSAAIIR